MTVDPIQTYGEARLPRYTSYPTAPRFEADIGADVHAEWLARLPAGEPVSLYLHVPFCRSMCWYCGCHTTITLEDAPIRDYLAMLEAEIDLVTAAAGHSLPVGAIHFGGGTPTIVQPHEFSRLMAHLRRSTAVSDRAEIAVEIDPRRLSSQMCRALGEAGVTRASLGVQSFDPVVQAAINRLQSPDQTRAAVDGLRRAGVGGLNFDLIYGLPHQTVASAVETAR
ncbi:MAG: radical SAM protein, partial [Phyllobacteriaceae bacterium]|nr:radical SAM protein [Phyllobacteriaceae bacterium]